MHSWLDLYEKLAQSLLQFQKMHSGDAGKALYDRCHKDFFISEHQWFSSFSKFNNAKVIDPFHVFVSFGDVNLPDDKRRRKILAWFRVLSVPPPKYDEMDFIGCPSIFATKLLTVRKVENHLEIWELFKQVMHKGQDGLSSDVFNKIQKWYDIDFPSVAVFLFWISPKNFMPLDKNTIRLLMQAQLLESRLKGFDEYKGLLRFRNSEQYIEVAKQAAVLQEDHKALSDYAKKLNGLYNLPADMRQRATDNDFRLIGFRILEGTQKKFSKILEVNKPYSFYNKFKIHQNGTVNLDPLNDVRLYARGGLNINVCAIVGKNGSGKSTITELLYVTIYNIACQFAEQYKGLKPVKGANVELFYLSNNLYKVVVKEGKVKVYVYNKNAKDYSDAQLIPEGQFKLDHFFYTIAVNYSHYGLNELYAGPWVSELFRRNDGYQVPLTITPFRKEGNININRENELVMARLLANLLEPVLKEDTVNIRMITEDRRTATQIRFSFNGSILLEIIEAKANWSTSEQKKILEQVYLFFNIRPKRKNKKLQDIVRDYIYRVLLTMPGRYAMYREFVAKKGKREVITNIKKYLQVINDDPSHATYRFKQAVNFLKYEQLFSIPQKKFISIERLSQKIDELKRSIEGGDKRKVIEFIPASFYNTDIKLSDGSDFRDLSSGEKQRIFAGSSLVYHLNNLSSVVNPSLVCYSAVNVIFDEIELYFHPDMQRTFLTYLLNYLGRVGFQNIYDLNFCFVTHSPFILSDIPAENILFLKKKGDEADKEVPLKTFGANIHELLMDGFFMEQTLGEFALLQVKQILQFHEKVKNNSDPLKLQEFATEYASLKNRFYFVKNSLGEVYISNIIQNHIREIEERLGEKSFIDEQVKRLKEEIDRLTGKENAKGKLSAN